jgi:hypothetical protein
MMQESGLKSVSERKNRHLRIHAFNLLTPDQLEFPPGFSPDSRPRSLRHALALIHHVNLAAWLLQIKRVPQAKLVQTGMSEYAALACMTRLTY